MELEHLSSEVPIRHDEALLSDTWLNVCLTVGSSESTPYFVLLACVSFAVPVKLSLPQFTSFLSFTLSARWGLFHILPLEGWVSGWKEEELRERTAAWCLATYQS